MLLTELEINQRIYLLKDARRHARKRPRVRKGTKIAGLYRKFTEENLSAADFPSLRDLEADIQSLNASSPSDIIESLPSSSNNGSRRKSLTLSSVQNYVAAASGTVPPSYRQAIKSALVLPQNSKLTQRELPLLERAILKERQALIQAWYDRAENYIQEMLVLRDEIEADSEHPVQTGFVQKVAKHLVHAMCDAAHALYTLESKQGHWQQALFFSEEAIRLRAEVAAEFLNAPLPAAPKDHLKRAYATHMLYGNTEYLREQLRDALLIIPGSASIASFLARYELRARNYPVAMAYLKVSQQIVEENARIIVDTNHELPDTSGGGENGGTGSGDSGGQSSGDPSGGSSADEPSWRSPPTADEFVTGLNEFYSRVLTPSNDPMIVDVELPSNYYSYLYTLINIQTASSFDAELEGMSQGEIESDTWSELQYHIPVAQLVYRCFIRWGTANENMRAGNFESAIQEYLNAIQLINMYIDLRYLKEGATLWRDFPYDEKATRIYYYEAPFQSLESAASEILNSSTEEVLRGYFYQRSDVLSLSELYDFDWIEPKDKISGGYAVYDNWEDLLWALYEDDIDTEDSESEQLKSVVDGPLLNIGLVLLPMALAEAYRGLNNPSAVKTYSEMVLNNLTTLGVVNQHIEEAFVLSVLSQALLEKAEAEYKSGRKARVEEGEEAEGEDAEGEEAYREVYIARDTYQEVLEVWSTYGSYTSNVTEGAASLQEWIAQFLDSLTLEPIVVEENSEANPPASPEDNQDFESNTQTVYGVETVETSTGGETADSQEMASEELLVTFEPPPETEALFETNPLIYSLIFQAYSRILQIDAGLNYIGYSPNHIPVWRFQYLLQRARYFADHARQTQSDYINFLSSAEREELQEIVASQTVSLEKANVQIESARVEQSSLEVTVAQKSKELADMNAENAATEAEDYAEFSEYAKSKETQALVASAVAGIAVSALTGGSSAMLMGKEVAIGVVRGVHMSSSLLESVSGGLNNSVAAQQRGLEEQSLYHAADEAALASDVSAAQLDVAQQALVVASLQKAAALMRHDFAVQNLAFLQNRTLNAQMWYRLADLIRGIHKTYLRYGVELAFLAEQAYEFEADQKLNVIRFDYDVDEAAELLAGDFLLKDLDTLEHHMLTTRRSREQLVKYTVSLAQEAPAALEQLRQTGRCFFYSPLPNIEKRFPGLYNVRVSSLAVTPFALMDSTRFSMSVTHLGQSMMRRASGRGVKSDATDTVAVTSWLHNLEIQANPDNKTTDSRWPVVFRLTAPETAIYSGVLAGTDQSVTPFVASGQKEAFQNLGAASVWRIDLSQEINRVVPGTLVDVVLDFTLAGYYDSALAQRVKAAPDTNLPLTQWLSAQQNYYGELLDFKQDGLMSFEVSALQLSPHKDISNLRALAILGVPRPDRSNIGQVMATFEIPFNLVEGAEGEEATLVVNHTPPDVSLNSGPDLQIHMTALVPGVSNPQISFNPGDDSPWIDGSDVSYTYSEPGVYTAIIRVVNDGRLKDYTATISVSYAHNIWDPVSVSVVPTLINSLPAEGENYQVGFQAMQSDDNTTVDWYWQLDDEVVEAGPSSVSYNLLPGKHVVKLVAVRRLNARIYGNQCYKPDINYLVSGLSITASSAEGADNSTLAQNLFGGQAISPVDTWRIEFPLENNPFLGVVDSADQLSVGLDELSDLVLALEYDVE